jgi:poly-beta-1,6-N-acetyl-D-glucosamine biosynthesis protein PgaD
MKTPASKDPDWPPIIGFRKVGPIIRLRDTIITLIAWIFLVGLLWELFYLVWDYFGYPLFELSETHSLNWQEFVNRIGGFASISLLLVLWLTFWGIVRRKELRRTHDPRSVSPLPLSDHAAIFGIPPETIERWRQSQVVVVQFDDSNRLANVIVKTPDSSSLDAQDLGEKQTF